MAARKREMVLLLAVLCGCATYANDDRDGYGRSAKANERRQPERKEEAAPSEIEGLAAERTKKLYETGYAAGYQAERKTYRRFGQLWPERLRRPVACMALPKECGEADGRFGFVSAVRDGCEPCTFPDTACDVSKVATARRLAEFRIGRSDGYASRLLHYQETGQRTPNHPWSPSDVVCRDEPRACGYRTGWVAADRAIADGREACAAAEIGCLSTRQADRARHDLLAPGERDRIRLDAGELRSSEQSYLSAKAEKAREEAALELLGKGRDLLIRLHSDATGCESTFGERRLVVKKGALAEWDALSLKDRERLQAALSARLGRGAPDLTLEVAEARHDLSAFVETLCIFGI